MKLKDLQTAGVLIAIPLLLYAIYINGYWAEPEPQKVPTVMVEAGTAFTEKEEILTVEKIEDINQGQMDELELLASCIEAEAGNQSILGKRLVADVILNRVDNPAYPNSIREVIYQPGQFAVVDNGAINTVIPTTETWQAVYKELTNRIDETILYFQAGHYGPYGEPWEQVGGHWFSTGGQV